ncbi:MAG: transglycosylase SLT domain-containing protein [Gemmatimonas sp.]|nr:transglycosylase SLT domain-containing protein [Gemmatimonas sp.]
MHDKKPRTERRKLRPGRESLVGLLKSPVTQLILVVTAVGQVVNTQMNGVDNGSHFASSVAAQELATVALAPTKATPDRQAGARKAEQLGAEYRRQGFNVSSQLARQIGEAAAEYSIDTEVAFGLVRAESSFRNVATSRVGAVGLTQLMPRTAAWIEPGVTRSQLRDPKTNLRVGFKYLRYLVNKYQGDERLALLAYNRGPGTVDRALSRGSNPDNGYADFVYGKSNHGHALFTR